MAALEPLASMMVSKRGSLAAGCHSDMYCISKLRELNLSGGLFRRMAPCHTPQFVPRNM